MSDIMKQYQQKWIETLKDDGWAARDKDIEVLYEIKADDTGGTDELTQLLATLLLGEWT